MTATPTALTKPHLEVHSLLVDLGFLVADEFKVGRYTLDMYIKEVHLGFEFDGPLHEMPKQQRHDKLRDYWLLHEAGIPIFRVDATLLKNKNQLKIDLLDFIETHSLTSEERRSKWV